MSTKPARNGARWTKEEEEEILASIKTGLSLRIIATRKQRTTGGIRSRLTQIACRFVEVDKMPLYEAAERTGIKPAHLRAVLSLKTEPAPHMTGPPIPKMEFNFQQTFSRTALQGRAEAAKQERLRRAVEAIVERSSYMVLKAAEGDKMSYLYELEHEHNYRFGNNETVTKDDLLLGFQQKFPLCTVTLAEDWIEYDAPPARGHRTRVLKSGIKIDWS
jgi:hypothetical protein